MANNVESRESGPGRGRRWAHHEKSMLRYMKNNNYSWAKIAAELNREEPTVRRYWYNYKAQLDSLTSSFDLLKRPWKSTKC